MHSINSELAEQVFENMTDDDKTTYERCGWYNGVSEMCVNGEDTETVLDIIETLKAEWILARNEAAFNAGNN